VAVDLGGLCVGVAHQAAKRGLDSQAIAETYNVSEPMAAFRLRTTGVARQLAAARARR
jgi:hypothetical protein